MLKKILFTILIIVSFTKGFTQNDCIVELTILDSQSMPLSNVNLHEKNADMMYVSSKNGVIHFPCSELPLEIEITHIGFKAQKLAISSAANHEIIMEINPYVLAEFTFNSIITVVNDEKIYILDYEFYHNNLVVLGYYERYNRSSIFLIDEFGDTLSETKLPGKANTLQKDCDNEIQLLVSDEVFALDYFDKRFQLRYLYTKATEGISLACLCNYEKGYLSGFYVNNQLYSYVSIDEDSILNYFRIIDNRNYLNQAENWGVSNRDNKAFDFNYLNNLEGRKLDFKKQMTVIEEGRMYKNEDDFFAGLNMNPNYDNRYLLNLHYYNNVINKAVSVPIFTIDDKLYLFNHVDGQIEKYSSQLELLSTVKIDYFEKRNWKRKIYFDDIESKVYTIFEKSGIKYVKEIDLKSGKIINERKIPIAFVSNVKVHNGSVYFLHKENDYLSSERKVVKLYSIKL